MTAHPAWTPASRPGIVPLHPLTFGTILGRSFVALRQNPKVLLGFALLVQTAAFLVIIVALGFIAYATFSRLDTLRPGTEEYETVTAGSVAVMIVASLVLGLAAGAVTVIVQGVVVLEVTHAVVAERLTLGALWRRVRPVFWRLLGYSLLVGAVAVVVLALIGGIVFGLGVVALPIGIVLGILFFLGLVPLYWWLVVKLLLVPAVILVERATIRGAIARSWRLTRGRFWSSFGVIILIVMIFGFVGQVANIPLSFLSFGFGTVISPTGDVEASGIIAVIAGVVLTYAVLLLVQSIAVVVQSTATALIYVDCRMRHEGLDLDLMEYVERRDAGAADLPDPYLQHIGRDQPSPYLVPAGAFVPPGYAPAGYAPQNYQAQGYPAPAYAPAQGYPAAAYPPVPPQPPVAPPAAPTQWAPPFPPPVTRDERAREPGDDTDHPQRDPLIPDGDEAQRWAEDELSNPVYREAEPTFVDRAARAVAEFLQGLFSSEVDGQWGLALAALVAIVFILVVIAAFVVWGMPRSTRRARAAQAQLFGEPEGRSAAELRAAADDAATRGAWADAVVLRFRGLARALDERGIVETPPGATVHAFARAAATAFPASADALESAAAAFDDVRYLRRPGTADLYARVADIDDALVRARPVPRDVPAGVGA